MQAVVVAVLGSIFLLQVQVAQAVVAQAVEQQVVLLELLTQAVVVAVAIAVLEQDKVVEVQADLDLL
jgi:hypothetical protein